MEKTEDEKIKVPGGNPLYKDDIKPDVILKNGDTTLKKDTDYTLTYKNNVKVSTDAAPAQITVKGKGSYTGSFKLDFSIVEKKKDNTEKTDAKSVKPDADEPADAAVNAS